MNRSQSVEMRTPRCHIAATVLYLSVLGDCKGEVVQRLLPQHDPRRVCTKPMMGGNRNTGNSPKACMVRVRRHFSVVVAVRRRSFTASTHLESQPEWVPSISGLKLTQHHCVDAHGAGWIKGSRDTAPVGRTADSKMVLVQFLRCGHVLTSRLSPNSCSLHSS